MSSPDAPDLDAIEAARSVIGRTAWKNYYLSVRDGTPVASIQAADTRQVQDYLQSLHDADLVAALRAAETKLAAIQAHFDHVYAEDDEGEYGNIPDIYDPDFYRGLDFGLRPIRAILDIAEGS